MSSAAPSNGAPAVESKSAKKRKARGAAATSSGTDGSATPAAEASQDLADANINGNDTDSPYMKELQKQLRNANKKLSGTVKAQSIVSENPGVSLDDLVASKKLNHDQKAQMERKPQLQEQVKSIEDQIVRFRQFIKDTEARFEKERGTTTESHQAEIAKARQEAADEARVQVLQEHEAELLTLTQFLNAASTKRLDESPETSQAEKDAFEDVLLKVYQGTSQAIGDIQKLAQGSKDKIITVRGEELDFTWDQVKQVSVATAPVETDSVEDADAKLAEVNETIPSVENTASSDPTIANAGLTELEDTVTIPTTTADAPIESSAAEAPEQTTVDLGNAVAEATWDPTSTADSWVDVQIPRDPAETDTGLTGTTGEAARNTNSWAEEAGESAAAEAKAAAENDGFQEVVHHAPRDRPRGRGRGEYRGRGRGDGSRGGRGRGDGERRGSGRGRGRGGGEGGSRGGRGGRGRPE